MHFFNNALKGSASSRNLLSRKDSFNQYPDSVWSIQEFAALAPPPDKFQFTELINRKGIDEALQLARKFYAVDSAADFLHQNNLNQLARQFVTENKSKEGLALMELAVELHPKEAWLWNNYADMQETAGNKDVAIRSSEKVLELLKDANGTDQSFNSRVKRSSAARLERLKKEKS